MSRRPLKIKIKSNKFVHIPTCDCFQSTAAGRILLEFPVESSACPGTVGSRGCKAPGSPGSLGTPRTVGRDTAVACCKAAAGPLRPSLREIWLVVQKAPEI